MKSLEALENIKECLFWSDEGLKDITIIKKELKALEIIKEKPQSTLWFIQHCDKEMEYEDLPYIFKEDITKEHFDLLKEVLLWGIHMRLMNN